MRKTHPEAERKASIFFEPITPDEPSQPTNDDLEKARIEYEIARNNAKAPQVRRAHQQALKALENNAKLKLERIEEAMQGNNTSVIVDEYSAKFPVERYPIDEIRQSFIEVEKATEIHLNAMKQRWEVLKKYNLPEDWRG